MSDLDEPIDVAPRWQDPATGEVDIAAVLAELTDIVERAKSMPLSSSAIVAREELLELIDLARNALPGEIARARRVLQDHDELRIRAEHEADQLLEQARAQAAHLVSRTEIVRQARHDAERTLLDADAQARRVRHEAEDYVDRKLAAFEIVLDRTIRTVQAGRDRLSGAAAVPAEEPVEQERDADGEFIPFDQDQWSAPTRRPTRGAERVFTVEVAALLRQPGSRRHVHIQGELPDLEVPTSRVPDGAEIVLDAVLEAVSEGILVTGTVRTPWEGICRRCLEPTFGVVEDEICELCCEGGDEETTYPLAGDLLALAPVVRDACILDLPLAPLCRADCAGLCPECGLNRNLEQCSCSAPLDPRWGALGALLGSASDDPVTGVDQSE